MKLITNLVVTLLVIFTSCEKENDQAIKLSNDDWYYLISTGGTIIGLDESDLIIYNKFENSLLSSEILRAYSNGYSVFGYQIQDSIRNYIVERNNRKISNRIDSKLKIKIVADISKKDFYLMLSEPFYINNGIYCFSLARKGITNNHWIYFFERNIKGIHIIGLYDVQKDQYLVKSNP